MEKSSFEEVLPVWKSHLWPERRALIEPTSAIDEEGLINMDWMQATSFFWKIEKENRLVGVISALHLESSLRLRGLWVAEAFRGQSLGSQLVNEALNAAEALQIKSVWTMARRVSLPFYEKCGFQAVKEVEGYEYGPHVIVKSVSFR